MTDQYNPIPARRGRPPNSERVVPSAQPTSEPTVRQADTQKRRRRREGMGAERNLKLHIPNELKDPNFEYRWVNDRPGRVQQLTKLDDWDRAPEMMEGTGLGTVTERAVDSYTGERAVLLRKPKEFYDSDKAEEAKLLDQRDEAMRRGPLPNPEGIAAEPDKTYVPGGRNIVNGR